MYAKQIISPAELHQSLILFYIFYSPGSNIFLPVKVGKKAPPYFSGKNAKHGLIFSCCPLKLCHAFLYLLKLFQAISGKRSLEIALNGQLSVETPCKFQSPCEVIKKQQQRQKHQQALLLFTLCETPHFCSFKA